MMISIKPFFTATLISAAVFSPAVGLTAGEMTVKITPDIASVEVVHNGGGIQDWEILGLTTVAGD
jgi:hypothetical protein